MCNTFFCYFLDFFKIVFATAAGGIVTLRFTYLLELRRQKQLSIASIMKMKKIMEKVQQNLESSGPSHLGITPQSNTEYFMQQTQEHTHNVQMAFSEIFSRVSTSFTDLEDDVENLENEINEMEMLRRAVIKKSKRETMVHWKTPSEVDGYIKAHQKVINSIDGLEKKISKKKLYFL